MIITETITLETLLCGGCGITFAIPTDWIQEKRRNAGGFTCPNGCTRVYRETDADRLKKQLEAKERELRESKCETLRERNMREIAESQKIASDRKIKRIQKGVCPCCNRSFTNLRRHMETKHSDAKQQSS